MDKIKLTREEFDSIEKDNNTFYLISDEMKVYKGEGSIAPEYKPYVPPTIDYFYAEALANTQLYFTKTYESQLPSIQYSIGDTEHWNDYSFASGQKISITTGQRCYFKSTTEFMNENNIMGANYIVFESTGDIKLGGDVNSMRNFADLQQNSFSDMFERNSHIIEADIFRDYQLATRCYSYMFSNCSSLIKLPNLPATTLADYCYQGMFNRCTKIKLSTTQDSTYKTAWSFPSDGVGAGGSNHGSMMFQNTGGTFTDSAIVNTTYYGAWD